jgi:hypothetical protein
MISEITKAKDISVPLFITDTLKVGDEDFKKPIDNRIRTG